MWYRHLKRVRDQVRAAACVESLDRRLLLSTTPTLVKDVNPSTAGSFPRDLTDVGGTLFFTASEGGSVWDNLWKSDGTPAGTVLVKDFGPPGGPGNARVDNLVASGGRLLFSAPDAEAPYSNRELWTSDGTPGGTVRVKDIFAGAEASDPEWLTDVNGTVFFAATDAAGGRELWKSDGTGAGTVRVRDIRSGTSGSDPADFAVFNGRLYFSARDGSGGRELWTTDGSSAGTVRVHNVNGSNPAVDILNMHAAAGRLYFVVAAAETAMELWRSDGTDAGTVRLRSGFVGGSDAAPSGVFDAGGATGFFIADDGESGWELWKTDGTAAGTTLLRDIVPGNGSSHPNGLVALNGLLYFGAFDADNDHELWRTDGTEAGTFRAVDIVPGPGASEAGWMTNFRGAIYFSANTTGGFDAADRELWKTDGTPAGTVRVADGAPGVLGSDPEELTVAGGKLFFTAAGAGTDRELWVSDGTAAGTRQLADANRGPTGSDTNPLADINGTLFFSAGADDFFRELWKTDGTAAGTVRVGDVLISRFGPAVAVGDTLYFHGYDPAAGWELWKSDGTAAGTTRIKDTTPAGGTAHVGTVFNFNGTVLFENAASQLWKTDGTEAGTVMVSDAVNPEAPLVLSGGVAYFGGRDRGDTSFASLALWRTDGTAAGTVKVAGPLPGFAELVDWNGTLFFRAQHPDMGYELWRSDGTAAGTYVVKDIFPVPRNGDIPPRSSNPFFLTPFHNGLLFFAQSDNILYRRLWRTDGTAAGTYQIGPYIGQGGTNAVIGNTFYFTTFDNGLWKSDGYSHTLVKYFEDSTPRILGGASGTLLLNYFTPATGNELWKSNGTASGTVAVADVMPGSASFSPDKLRVVNGHTAFFAGEHPEAGRELWKMYLPAVAGRYVFNNGSAADGNDVGANEADDAAIDRTRALLPGERSGPANATNYHLGINGIMVDIAGLPEGVTLTANDFSFRAFNVEGPGGGTTPLPPWSVTVRRGAGAGGTDRVTIAWGRPVIRNAWLRVQVNAGDRTGLPAPDVFYFGSLPGDTGGAGMPGVDAADVVRARVHVGQTTPAALAACDVNRDGVINAADVAIVRGNLRHRLLPFDAPRVIAAVAAPPPPDSVRRTVRPERRGLLAEPAPTLFA